MAAFKKLLDNLSFLFICVFAFLLPIAFTPLTTEFYESAKFFLLCLTTLLLIILWGLKIFADGKIEIKRTPLDIFLLLLLATAIISTAQFLSPSPARFISLFGTLPKVYGSLTYIIALILFYFLVVSNLKNEKQTVTVSSLLVFSGTVLGIFTLLSYFKISLGIPLIGSFANSTVFLAMILPLTIRLLYIQPALGSIVNLILALALVLCGSYPAWIGAIFALGFTSYNYKDHFRKIVPSLVLILGIAALMAVLSFHPLLKDKTPLGKFGSSFSREAQLPFLPSWKISASAFRDSPIFGTGPSTYLFDFTQYKPIEYNQTPFWNVRLNAAHDFYLQIWAELGGLGILLMLAIVVSFILFSSKHQDENGLITAGLTFLVLMAFSPMGILTQTAGFLILALAFSSGKSKEHDIRIVDLWLRYLVYFIILIPLLIFVAVSSYFMVRLALGEYYHRQALNATVSNRAVDIYNNLVAAERVNPYADTYRTDLAQTNFALANAIATQKGPTEASPGGSLTDNDKKNIQQFLSQSIAEGRSAVSISPRSAADWEILGAVYRQITGVAQNALQFSLDAYGRAVKLDPFNPVLRLSIGGIYYQLKNYDLAIRFFDDAISLKPDYSNGLYNLAIALRDKGNYQEASLIAEKLVSNLSSNPNSKDYQVASQLLEEIKAKTPASKASTASPSANLQNDQSSLTGKNLPKVLDLPSPGSISTPPAVKK